jgi:hypothetical protein
MSEHTQKSDRQPGIKCKWQSFPKYLNLFHTAQSGIGCRGAKSDSVHSLTFHVTNTQLVLTSNCKQNAVKREVQEIVMCCNWQKLKLEINLQPPHVTNEGNFNCASHTHDEQILMEVVNDVA